MEMRLDGPQIAVFMDFENVATSAEANLGVRGESLNQDTMQPIPG